MGKTQIVVPGGGGGGGATTGRITVNSPKSTIATTSTDFFSLFAPGGLPVSSSMESPYTIPFPGTVKKVIIRSILQGQSLNGGTLEIMQQTASVGALTGLGGLGPLTASGALQEFAVNYPFAAGDGFLFSMLGAAVGARFLVTLEIEYALV